MKSISITIDEAKVYSFNLENYFDNASEINQYICEFYSQHNLAVPFPAVMINHIGKDFINTVHSYNRVLNDIFENDAINSNQVLETAINFENSERYETFFNLGVGPFKPAENIKVIAENKKCIIEQNVPIEINRLNNKNYHISKIFTFKKGSALEKNKNYILKVSQPNQPLFYGRLLSGIINKDTGSFSANHSYYDCSNTIEYFSNNTSMRKYPYFKNSTNKVIIFPIMSPSRIEIYIRACSKNKYFESERRLIVSPSTEQIELDVNEFVELNNINEITSFDVVAESLDSKIPTRVNVMLVYGQFNSKSKLNSCINTSLSNNEIFIPENRGSFIWGQIVIDKDYNSYLGLCFNHFKKGEAEFEISFYDEAGFIDKITKKMNYHESFILNDVEIKKYRNEGKFLWFIAESKTNQLSAQTFHIHCKSHNASGEHHF